MTTTTTERDSFEIVKGVLRYFEGEQFCSKMQILHEAFYQLKQNERYRDILRHMFFDTNRSFPYSPDLQQDLLNMEQAGLLSTANPTFTYTHIREALRDTFDRYQSDMFTEGELLVLQEIAKSLKSQLQ